MKSKILLAYFSRAGNNYVGGSIVNLAIGNTEVAAKMIEQLTDAQVFKIEPARPYSANYTTCTQEAQQEIRSNARPELAAYLEDIESFDTIILGYPNYWNTVPMPVYTFLEKYDFAGKKILPFCTHEGSGLGRSESDIKKLCPGADVRKGLAITGSRVKNAKSDLEHWLKNQI